MASDLVIRPGLIPAGFIEITCSGDRIPRWLGVPADELERAKRDGLKVLEFGSKISLPPDVR